MRRPTFSRVAAGLTLLAAVTAGCDSFKPTEVRNPNLTDQQFLGTPGAGAAWLRGAQRPRIGGRLRGLCHALARAHWLRRRISSALGCVWKVMAPLVTPCAGSAAAALQTARTLAGRTAPVRH